jgi:hypothetical protein
MDAEVTVTARYWFRPKQYGYGATPVTWEGWAFTLLVAVLIAATSGYVFGGGTVPSAMAIVAWAVVVAAIIAGTVVVVRSKTEGSWRWRWGDPE